MYRIVLCQEEAKKVTVTFVSCQLVDAEGDDKSCAEKHEWFFWDVCQKFVTLESQM